MAKICPQLRSAGACVDRQCAFSHDLKVCEPCSLMFFSTGPYEDHLRGKRHLTKISGRSTNMHCSLCVKKVVGLHNWAIHTAGRQHQANARHQEVSPDVDPEEEAVQPGYTHCGICNRNIPSQQWSNHLSSLVHRKNEKFAAYKAAVEEGKKDKHGVTVSHGDDALDFGIVGNAAAAQGLNLHLIVKTTVPSSKVVVRNLKMSTPTDRSMFSVKLQGNVSSMVFGRELHLVVNFRSQYGGRFDDRVEIVFEDTLLKQSFVIVRFLRAIVGNAADYERLKPIAPYIPRSRTARQAPTNIVPGPSPAPLRAIPYVVELPIAPIPADLVSLLSGGSVSEIASRLRRTVLPAVLNSESYGRHFKRLIWVEEHRMERDLEMYDISDARLTRHEQYYYLGVPGLAEKRPSVLVGDQILVQRHDAPEGNWFDGQVHVVRNEEVGLCFNSSFRGHTTEQLYNVRFRLNRYPLRRQHQALDTVFVADRLLFPILDHVKDIARPLLAANPLPMYNKLIAQNEPQAQAVLSIMRQKPGSVPFVVFGPPGTGKTVTIVEAIRQVLRSNPSARILACAPSNSAADLIASRLIMLGKSSLFRLYAPSRYENQMPDELKPFVCMKGRHFSVPETGLLSYKVVVATCVSGSIPHGIGIPRGHFSHIFVDEAGHATEPEAMIAIKTMADNATNIVLSGDPKQLGPIIRSPIARELGMETSYLERMMDRETHTDSQKSGISFVKLVKNFRSHNSILKFPNEQFYQGDLQPCGDAKVVNSYLGWTHLPNKKFPIVFHAIHGKDMREASSPSFFNVDEILQVKSYVETLRHDRSYRISDGEIGVIAPYNAQCRKIRTSLRAVADGVKVGSVEEFQGQERRAIIVSTVRSSREFVEYDLKHTLGFVANPRRFNVAVTRAQALLIVVGDPSVLSLDPLWRTFLNYVHNNGGWRGQDPDWDTHEAVRSEGGYDRELQDAALDDMNVFTRRLESSRARAGVAPNREEDDGDDDANVDRPWRDVE